MSEQLKRRLAELESEYESGQKMLAELDARRQNLTTTLLRIEGAMQVLRELLGREGGSESAPGDHL